MNNSPIEKVKLGIIGVGGRGSGVASNLVKHPLCECIHICDTNDIRLEKAKKKFETAQGNTIKTTNKVEELLADEEINLVLVATPDFLHKEHALAVCKAKKHLFLEKPIGINLGECHAILSAVKEAGIIFETGYVLRYTPFFSQIKDMVSHDELGRINYFRADEFYYGGTHFFRGWQRWRKNVGSIMIQKITHDFDLLYWIFGEPKKVYTMGGTREFIPENNPKGSTAERCSECPKDKRCEYYVKLSDGDYYSPAANKFDEKLPWLGPKNVRDDTCIFNSEKEIVDHSITVVEFKNGLHGVVNMNYFPAKTESNRFWQVMGSKGQIDANAITNTITFSPRHGDAEVISYEPSGISEGGHGGGDYVQSEAFIDALTDPNGPHEARAGVKSSYWSSVMVMAAVESLLTGKPVDTEEFRKNHPYPE